MDSWLSFGQWLRRRRRALDLTQEQLARKVGCSKGTIVKIEADERRPSRQLAELLAQQLEIPPEERDDFVRIARTRRIVDSPEEVALPTLTRPAARTPTRLPTPPTPLVGRQRELAEIEQLLQDDACRLLTLAGPGGIGKTRLALAAAGQRSPHLTDGVCFVPLSAVTAPGFVAPSLADALGIEAARSVDLLAQICCFLSERQVLLALDNLEHLLVEEENAATITSLIAGILASAPKVQILTTSRERLNMPGEWIFEVQGLPVPTADGGSPAVAEASAMALFVQTARCVSPGFALDESNYGAVVYICQLVEGMPLAIELAAAWTRTLSCTTIAQEIEAGLDFLASSARQLPQRHRSVRAALDHSWHLLAEAEQTALARLSVFRSGFDRLAAAEVAAVPLPTLAALIDKSLVTHPQPDRFDLHELVRQYAAEQLAAQPDLEQATRLQQSRYYLALLQDYYPALTSENQQEALAGLTAEIDNLRHAWEWAILDNQVELLRMATWPLGYYYELRNHFQEGEAAFELATDHIRLHADLATDDGRWKVALARLQTAQAFFIFRRGRIHEAQELLATCLDILEKGSHPAVLADALWAAGYADWFAGQFARGLDYFQRAYAITQALDLPYKSAINASFLGGVAHELGQYAQARRWLEESVAQGRTLGDPRVISFAIGFYSRTAVSLGAATEMVPLLAEGLRLAQATGDRFVMGLVLEQLSRIQYNLGHTDKAHQLLNESIAHFQEIGDCWSLSRAWVLCGDFALAEGELNHAGQDYWRAFQTAHSADLAPHALAALAGLGDLLAREKLVGEAYSLAHYVAHHHASAHDTRQRATQMEVVLRDQLGSELAAELAGRVQEWALAQITILIPHQYREPD
jgi:predicted ATPase/DNA-binding XRE family transcriptional regulator